MTEHVWQIIGTFSHLDEPVEWYAGNDYQEACTRLGQLLISNSVRGAKVLKHGDVKREIMVKHAPELIAADEVVSLNSTNTEEMRAMWLERLHIQCLQEKGKHILVVVPEDIHLATFSRYVFDEYLRGMTSLCTYRGARQSIVYTGGSCLSFSHLRTDFLRGMEFDQIYVMNRAVRTADNLFFLRSRLRRSNNWLIIERVEETAV